MVFEEVEASTKGVKALEARAYSPTHPRAKFDENNGALSGKKRMEPPRERHHLNNGGNRR
jgi:hypothetical protein